MHQHSQRKTLRSALNEHRTGFDATPPGSQKAKLNALRPSTSSDGMDGDMPPHYQDVRPFESQHKEMYNSGYESYEPFRMQMPMMYRSQTPNRSKYIQVQVSDEEHQEMIIPKDFSEKKFAQHAMKQRMAQ